MATVARTRLTFTALFRGWRHILLGSWFNLLLFLIPVSWALNLTMNTSHTLRFILSLLSLIPLVNLHDLSTHELALRIGGSKAGLVNASLSNMVSIVVAICGLRKCHLTFVQSTLMGSMLSKLLLVLGLCFFAGGTRFFEQGFDPTAVQLHSSLLSVSVAALFMPAVYHFALGGSATDIPDVQKMVYGGYLIFQLWSHSQLYTDKHNRRSMAFPSKEGRTSRSSSQELPRDSSSKEKDKLSDDCRSPSLLSENGRNVENLRTFPMHRNTVYLSPVSTCQPQFSSSQLSFSAPQSATGSQVGLLGAHEELSARHTITRHPMPRVASNASAWSSISGATAVSTGSQDGTEKIESPVDPAGDSAHDEETRISIFLVVVVLVIATVAASVTADWLVDSLDGVTSKIDKEWVGLILLPAVTSLAECMTAVNVSVKDELSFSIGVAVGSAIVHRYFGMGNGQTPVLVDGSLPVPGMTSMLFDQ
ncbi:hypothetical protein H0H93_000981 [Arthromyces matolae]|nr:hypothetical protein H0H93_000981 [Arthromyces matolae]